jgi:hypothetical protein
MQPVTPYLRSAKNGANKLVDALNRLGPSECESCGQERPVNIPAAAAQKLDNMVWDALRKANSLL